MKCGVCGKQDPEETTSLSEYGRNRIGCKDTKSYCSDCFDKKYPQLHNRIDNEKSDD